MVAVQERAIQTRHRLLLAAAVEFDLRGFLGTRLVDIATRADVTRGSLYFHFDSKSHVASALTEQQYASWAQYIATRRAQGFDGVELLMLFAHDLVTGFRDDVSSRAAMRLITEVADVGVPLPMPFGGWITDVRALLEEARELGQIDAEADLKQAAWVVTAAIFGVQAMSEHLEQRQKICDRLDTLWLYLLPGLAVTDVERHLERVVAAG